MKQIKFMLLIIGIAKSKLFQCPTKKQMTFSKHLTEIYTTTLNFPGIPSGFLN